MPRDFLLVRTPGRGGRGVGIVKVRGLKEGV